MASNSEQTTPPKRPRGRPRIHPIDSRKGTRPRGRPQIHPLGDAGSKQSPARPQGRPRKRSQDEIDDDDPDFINKNRLAREDERPRKQRSTRLSGTVSNEPSKVEENPRPSSDDDVMRTTTALDQNDHIIDDKSPPLTPELAIPTPLPHDTSHLMPNTASQSGSTITHQQLSELRAEVRAQMWAFGQRLKRMEKRLDD
ncbi:high mobility group AT-hook protein 2 [Microdochium nivale]|nr:high mobility group AT-hook protein 2 [Microdochium nivale]